MKYEKVTEGKFISRPNRFVAVVDILGEECRVHVKNTGRCKELLVPGAKVYLEDFEGRMGSRKMRYSLVAVEKVTDKGTVLINMDSQAPNAAVREALSGGSLMLPGFGRASFVKWEHAFGDSRIDFYVENEEGSKGLVEVKGVTLEKDGFAKFPDAPTERGVKHIHELERAQEEGYYAAVLFVVQMKGVKLFAPNWETHAEFGGALRNAAKKGVHVLAYDCRIGIDRMELDEPVKVKI